jgi:hypothetical protein
MTTELSQFKKAIVTFAVARASILKEDGPQHL